MTVAKLQEIFQVRLNLECLLNPKFLCFKLLPSEEMTDVIPAMPRHHKTKKTWVTDVNVYSKKKKLDDMNDLFGADDNDPLDEYGNIKEPSITRNYYCITLFTFLHTLIKDNGSHDTYFRHVLVSFCFH